MRLNNHSFSPLAENNMILRLLLFNLLTDFTNELYVLQNYKLKQSEALYIYIYIIGTDNKGNEIPT